MVDISIWMKYELMTSTFSGMLISKGNHPHLAASSSYVQVRELWIVVSIKWIWKSNDYLWYPCTIVVLT